MFPNEKVFINITHALLHTKNIYYVYYTTQWIFIILINQVTCLLRHQIKNE